jgi:hypothetical protein
MSIDTNGPQWTLVQHAAKVGYEPNVTDAAK